LDAIPERHVLPNKPLVEAIFELRWALAQDGGDPGFRLLLGRYYERIRKHYPTVRDLPSAHVPDEMTPYQVRHQFVSSPGPWPLTQVGPGIMTVNETSGYVWESFRPRLVEAIGALFESYPKEVARFAPVQASLRYIDSIPFDRATNDAPLLVFLRDHLHTAVDIEPLLFESEAERLNPVRFSLTLSYPLKAPRGIVTLTVARGKRQNLPSVIWDTSVLSKLPHVPNEMPTWEAWLEDAHRVMDRWFFALTRGKLLETFEGQHANGTAIPN
jgi:uncharacterized protein (TIGR04255 family)